MAQADFCKEMYLHSIPTFLLITGEYLQRLGLFHSANEM